MPKPLQIDTDLMHDTLQYVRNQIATMRKFGDGPKDWDDIKENALAVKVAQYPQQLRNMRKKESKP